MTSRPDRRHALTLAATVGLSPAVLAACGGDDNPGAEAPVGELDTGHTPDAPDPGPLTNTDEIPVGGGKIFPDQQVVVTQPTEGEFKCFTAVCTHQGCIVSSVSDGEILCDCHGSAYSIDDGSVLNPPATQPLAEKAITVNGDRITLS
jgi:Rieske Fe-S protein